jgi:CTP synthase (UTP-ammonia lyase)
MNATVRIALVGDHDETITAHRAIPVALQRVSAEASRHVEGVWLATDTIDGVQRLAGFDAVWCVPGSPYRDMDGALRAIRHARETGLPFLGTCGGFQHAVIEVARDVLGWTDADHAETAPDATRAVIHLLECGLVEASETLRLQPGSRLAQAYGEASITEGYRCRYGLNPSFQAALLEGPLRAAAFGPDGDVRAIELDGHPFFVATLFQPERAALAGRTPPLARALVEAALQGVASCC